MDTPIRSMVVVGLRSGFGSGDVLAGIRIPVFVLMGTVIMVLFSFQVFRRSFVALGFWATNLARSDTLCRDGRTSRYHLLPTGEPSALKFADAPPPP